MADKKDTQSPAEIFKNWRKGDPLPVWKGETWVPRGYAKDYASSEQLAELNRRSKVYVSKGAIRNDETGLDHGGVAFMRLPKIGPMKMEPMTITARKPKGKLDFSVSDRADVAPARQESKAFKEIQDPHGRVHALTPQQQAFMKNLPPEAVELLNHPDALSESGFQTLFPQFMRVTSAHLAKLNLMQQHEEMIKAQQKQPKVSIGPVEIQQPPKVTVGTPVIQSATMNAPGLTIPVPKAAPQPAPAQQPAQAPQDPNGPGLHHFAAYLKQVQAKNGGSNAQ